jgi:aryl-alcohol dehydrogenase-like predicted oxidoreductase
MDNRMIGDVEVFPIGLGCMQFSGRRMVEHRDRAIRTIHAALNAGVTLLDTADIYAPDARHVGHNEELVAQAVASYEGRRPVIATKGGITRVPGPDGEVWGRDGRPEALLEAAARSTARLGVDTIDLYFLHRADPRVHFNDQIAGLVAVKEQGLARRIGLSNVTAPMLQRALDIAGGPRAGGIVAVQNERSPRYRADSDVLDLCTTHGIAYLPWSPLTGAELFADHAAARGISPQQLTLAWLLAQSPVVVPIPGSSRPETILASVDATRVSMSALEIDELSALPYAPASLYPDSEPPPPL